MSGGKYGIVASASTVLEMAAAGAGDDGGGRRWGTTVTVVVGERLRLPRLHAAKALTFSNAGIVAHNYMDVELQGVLHAVKATPTNLDKAPTFLSTVDAHPRPQWTLPKKLAAVVTSPPPRPPPRPFLPW